MLLKMESEAPSNNRMFFVSCLVMTGYGKYKFIPNRIHFIFLINGLLIQVYKVEPSTEH